MELRTQSFHNVYSAGVYGLVSKLKLVIRGILLVTHSSILMMVINRIRDPPLINGSLENSVNQIGESRVGLRSSEKAAETEGHSSPLSANTELQEHQHPPLEFKKKDNSDRASPKSSNSEAWEEVVATMEWSHEGDLLDLREETEALKARHQEEILAANSKKLVLQKRVKKLLEQKSTNDLREENVRLCNLVATLGSENEESNAMLQSARTQNQQLQGQLAESLDTNSLVRKNLLRACQDAEYYRNRSYQLNYTLEQQPGKHADVDCEIKLRDHRYSDLELKAGACLTAMSELEKKCLEGHKSDCAEVADLKTRLQKQDAEIASLKASKDIFQRHSEEVIEKLAGRVLPSNLFDAMNEYFQLVIEENGILKRKVEEQLVEISGDRDRAKLLAYDNQSLKTQQILDEEIQSELEDKIRVQDIELGRLEFKIDCVHYKISLRNQNHPQV